VARIATFWHEEEWKGSLRGGVNGGERGFMRGLEQSYLFMFDFRCLNCLLDIHFLLTCLFGDWSCWILNKHVISSNTIIIAVACDTFAE